MQDENPSCCESDEQEQKRDQPAHLSNRTKNLLESLYLDLDRFERACGQTARRASRLREKTWYILGELNKEGVPELPEFHHDESTPAAKKLPVNSMTKAEMILGLGGD